MKRTAVVLSWLIVALFAAGASAGEKKVSVEEIMKIIDETLTIAKDQKYAAEVRVIRDGKTIKSMKFEVLMKGLVMKRVMFTAPGDVKGMAVLTTSDGLMYVYMPSYKRVRRVASHVRNQGFMGTDFSPEELAAASLSVGWNAKLLSEDAKAWTLELTPKSGNETGYARMKVRVNKQYRGVEKIESFDSNGKLVRTQDRSNFKKFGPVTIPVLMVVTDHTTGSRSELHFSDCVVNTGISDEEFSKRALMRE